MARHTHRPNPRNVTGLTTLDDFLEQEGRRREFEAIAIEEVRAWQASKVVAPKNRRQRAAKHKRQDRGPS
jgi:hypothetical protein